MIKYDPLPEELRKLGLDKKEADIYLTLLEMGPSTVQELARAVDLSRPTVYRVLDDLQSKQLATKGKENKRTFFTANSPDSLLRVLKVKRRRAEEQEREFLRIISVLQTKYHLLSDTNEIKTYRGSHGKKMVLDDLSSTGSKSIYVLYSKRNGVDPKKLHLIYRKIKKRQGSLSVKELYRKNLPENIPSYIKTRTSPEVPNFDTSTFVISDKFFFFEKDKIFVIEQENIVKMMKILHKTFWNCASEK